MTSNADRADRADALLQLLRAHPDITSSEVATRLGVSGRTVQRDIARLRERGVAIEASRGRGGGIRLAERFRLAPIPFTPDEAAGLWLSLAMASSVDGVPFATGAERAMGRILGALPPERRRELRALRQRILVGRPARPALVAEAHDVSPAVLSAFEQAFSRKRLMSCEYEDAQGRRSRRRLEPHGLLLQVPLWYVLAYDHLRAAPRTFRMDRMSRPALLDARFVPSPLASSFPELFEECDVLR